MATVSERFDDFMKGLELTEAERTTASEQQAALRTRLREQFPGVQHDFLVGSYARKTAIRPLNDIDLFLVLDPRVHADRHSQEPVHILDRLRSALRRCYPSQSPSGSGPQIRLQGRSVNIEFTGSGIGYDVIPAFSVSPDRVAAEDMVYQIPDRERRSWIETNPAQHRQHCVDANKRAGGMLNRLIKAAKHWNRGRRDSNGDKPLRSFHLEVMAYEAFKTKPTDERRGLRDLFAFLTSRVMERCPDPAGLGPHIDIGMQQEERSRLQRMLLVATAFASDAIQQEERGNHDAAWGSWRSLLARQS